MLTNDVVGFEQLAPDYIRKQYYINHYRPQSGYCLRLAQGFSLNPLVRLVTRTVGMIINIALPIFS